MRSYKERRSLSGESAAAVAFCHSVGGHSESLQPRVDSSSSSSEDEDEASQAPVPAVTTSAASKSATPAAASASLTTVAKCIKK